MPGLSEAAEGETSSEGVDTGRAVVCAMDVNNADEDGEPVSEATATELPADELEEVDPMFDIATGFESEPLAPDL